MICISSDLQVGQRIVILHSFIKKTQTTPDDELTLARKQANLTQEEVAKRMKTTKSAVSRLESSLVNEQHSPSLSTLRRYAAALGYKLEISFVAR